MTVEHRVELEAGILWVECDETLADDDLVEFRKVLRSDPDFRAGLAQLYDFRRTRHFAIRTKIIQEMAELPPHLDGDSRRAILVATPAAYGLARMYQTLRSDQKGEVEIFEDIEEALAWLAGRARSPVQGAPCQGPSHRGTDAR